MGRKKLTKEESKRNLQVYVEDHKIKAVGGDKIAKEIAYKAIEKESKRRRP